MLRTNSLSLKLQMTDTRWFEQKAYIVLYLVPVIIAYFVKKLHNLALTNYLR